MFVNVNDKKSETLLAQLHYVDVYSIWLYMVTD
jgi:hypothetical protein